MSGISGNFSIIVKQLSCYQEHLEKRHKSNLAFGQFIIADSDSIFRRTLLGYYAEGMHANF